MSSGTTLYLVRHASTAWNDEGRWQCLDDKPINDKGHVQAEAVSNEFLRLSEKLDFSRVYSSPLMRAKQTAGPIAKKLGLEVFVEPLLRELDCGLLSGLKLEEAKSRFSDFYSRLEGNWLDERYPDGETHREYVSRCVLPALDRIFDDNRDRAVIAVTHAGFIRATIALIMGTPAEIPLRGLCVDNCAYFKFDLERTDDEGLTGRVSAINVTAHLRKEGL